MVDQHHAPADRLLARRDKLLSIQAARGVAALLVVIYHAGRGLSLPQYLGYTPLRNWFGFGHAGVDFFFVLSGFIIAFVHRSDLGRPDRLDRYLRRRATRIYPIYWIITGVVIVQALFSSERAQRLAPGHLLASLTLFPMHNDPLIGVAWTLIHEILFYLCFGIAILRFGAGIALLVVNAGMIAAVLIGGHTGVFLIDFFASPLHLEFLMGIAAAIIVQDRSVPVPRFLAFCGAVGFLAAGLAENAGPLAWAKLGSEFAFGLSSTVLIIGLAVSERKGQLKVGQFGALLGASSYSLYLLHETVIGLGSRTLAAADVIHVVPGWIVLLVLTGVATVSAIALHCWVERPLLERLQRHTRGREALLTALAGR